MRLLIALVLMGMGCGAEEPIDWSTSPYREMKLKDMFPGVEAEYQRQLRREAKPEIQINLSGDTSTFSVPKSGWIKIFTYQDASWPLYITRPTDTEPVRLRTPEECEEYVAAKASPTTPAPSSAERR